MPTGEDLATLLPRLARALSGDGPALLPVPDDPASGPSDTASLLDAGSPLGPGEDHPDDPTAFVIATSGSTGRPKGVLLSRFQLAASAAATEARLGGPGHWMLALPAWHVAGLQVLLRAIAAHTTPTILDTAHTFTAERFVAAARRLPDGRRYVSLVPAQLHAILADRAATDTLAAFDAVLVGGAATPAGLVSRAGAAGIRVVLSYGMTETCGGCVYDGRPLEGVTIGIDDGGRIALSGPMVARGYRNQPHDPSFSGGRGRGTGSVGTYLTDDIGEVRGGMLTVFGRADEMIVTGGHKVSPALVEAAVVLSSGVRDAVVVGTPDGVWGEVVTAVVTTESMGKTVTLDALRAAVSDLPGHCRPRRLVVLDELPRIGPGKPDRAAVRRLAIRHLGLPVRSG